MQVTIGSTQEPVVNYHYDNANKLTTVTQNGATVTKCYQAGQSGCTGSDPAGRLHAVNLPNGITVTYGYDSDSHITSMTYGTLGSLTYGYDADGRRTTVDGSLAKTSLPAVPRSAAHDCSYDSLREDAPRGISDVCASAVRSLICCGDSSRRQDDENRNHRHRACL